MADWRFNFNTSLLIVVDMQERLMKAVDSPDVALNHAMAMVRIARQMNMEIVVTEQVPEKLGNTVAPLAALLQGIPPRPKRAFSAAQALAWRIPNDIILIGVETHICIRQTAFDFLDQEKRVAVLADAVTSISEHDHYRGLEEIRRAGVRVPTVQSIVMEMLGSADAPGFKNILQILKEHAGR